MSEWAGRASPDLSEEEADAVRLHTHLSQSWRNSGTQREPGAVLDGEDTVNLCPLREQVKPVIFFQHTHTDQCMHAHTCIHRHLCMHTCVNAHLDIYYTKAVPPPPLRAAQGPTDANLVPRTPNHCAVLASSQGRPLVCLLQPCVAGSSLLWLGWCSLQTGQSPMRKVKTVCGKSTSGRRSGSSWTFSCECLQCPSPGAHRRRQMGRRCLWLCLLF